MKPTRPPPGGADQPPPAGHTRHIRARRQLSDLTITAPADPDAERLAAWDNLVVNTPGSDVAQLPAWATVRCLAGYRHLYILASSGPELLGGALLLPRRRIPGLGQIAYLPYGPVLADTLDTHRPTVHSRLADVLAAVHVDLTPAGEARLRNLAPARRHRPGRRPARHRPAGVWPRTPPPASASPAITCTPSTSTLRREATSCPLIGEVGATPVAAELLTGCGGVLTSRITGLDRTHPTASKLNNVASSMIWHAIRWGHNHGLPALRPRRPTPNINNSFDANARARSILTVPDRFTTKFGGQPLTYPPALELIDKRASRAGYDLLRRNNTGQKLLTTIREALRRGAADPPAAPPAAGSSHISTR